MTLARQLYAMLSIAIIGALAIFATSYIKMNMVYEKTNYVTVNSLPSVLSLNNAMRLSLRFRLLLWEYITQDDAQLDLKTKQEINLTLKSSQMSFQNTMH